jgi:hypothetical protein
MRSVSLRRCGPWPHEDCRAREYHRELAARLRRRIAIDATCWHGVDPRTLLLTSARPEELLEYGFLSYHPFDGDR